MYYTADDARSGGQGDLDARIKAEVEHSNGNSGYLRVYIEDPWVHRIQAELEERGFKNVQVPEITLKGDVYFEW